MGRPLIANLVAQLYNGKLDRRAFMKRATAAGLSATLVGQVIARYDQVSAQDATPAAGGKASDIGNASIERITDTSKGVIKFYSSWPLTAAYQDIGGDAVDAVNLCLEDFGAAAGGFAIQYEALDDGIAANNGRWDGPKETENAQRVIGDPDAMVYMATYNSNAAKVSIPLTNEAGLAQISYANTYPGLTKAIPNVTEEGEPDIYYPTGKRNYMRTIVSDEYQGANGANWAYTTEGKRKAYVLHDQTLYGQGVADVFQQEFAKLGGEVLGFEGYDPTAGEYQSLMISIADKEPDILYVGATVENNAPKLIQDMRSQMGPEQVTFLGPDGLINQEFIDGAGGAAEGAYITFAGFPPNELQGPGGDFATRATERLGHSPDAYSVYSYEATVVALQAIDQVGEKDRTKILDAMMATTEFLSLVGGTWSFTETGDTDATTMSVNVVENNAFKFVANIATS
jgi:branched-chain amino acid transport system substrate-binding protein